MGFVKVILVILHLNILNIIKSVIYKTIISISNEESKLRI